MKDKYFEILTRIVIFWTIFAVIYSLLLIIFSQTATELLFNDYISNKSLHRDYAYISAYAENKTIIKKEIIEPNKKLFEQLILVFGFLGGKSNQKLKKFIFSSNNFLFIVFHSFLQYIWLLCRFKENPLFFCHICCLSILHILHVSDQLY